MMRWKIFKIHVLEDPFSFLGKEEEPLAGRSDINYSPKYKYTHMTPGGGRPIEPQPPPLGQHNNQVPVICKNKMSCNPRCSKSHNSHYSHTFQIMFSFYTLICFTPLVVLIISSLQGMKCIQSVKTTWFLPLLGGGGRR